MIKKGKKNKKILLIDNYDSFSYNLYQIIGSENIQIVRNDEVTVTQIRELNPGRIVISPGPGKPADAGICVQAVRELCGEFPIIGICLGHQSIFEAFGGTVSYAKNMMHGKSSLVDLDPDEPLFIGMDKTVQVARYHSLAAVESTLPNTLKIIARTSQDGEIMAVRHKEYPVYGLQFHPESILTPEGSIIMQNFMLM
ncbi:MAG: aminodeoxychorismate/anthranilate synthase component II [Oscillospiraceae bacterium]|nr:aminodeoxychorismate/anthranilate synthase component II [Oscillospiraceae bacterium]